MSNLVLAKPIKHAMRSTTLGIMISATVLFAIGCEKENVATDPASQSTPGSTKILEAADLVGYDGKKLRKSVDGIKEANERHGHELDKMTESQPEQ